MMQDPVRPPDIPEDAWQEYLAYHRSLGGPQEDDRQGFLGTLSDYARGAAHGLQGVATSTARGVGGILALDPRSSAGDRLIGWANRQDARSRDFYDPRGDAGFAGEMTGRVLGEGATAYATGSGVVSGLKGTRAGNFLAGMGQSKSALVRSAARTVPGAPVSAAIGAGDNPNDPLAGAVGNVALDIAGGWGLARLAGSRVGRAIERTDLAQGIGRWLDRRLGRTVAGAADAPPPNPPGTSGTTGGGSAPIGPVPTPTQPVVPTDQIDLFSQVPDVEADLASAIVEQNPQYWLRLIEAEAPDQVKALRELMQNNAMGRSGGADPRLIMSLAGASVGGLGGAAVGASFPGSPEERKKEALRGALVGGVGMGAMPWFMSRGGRVPPRR